MWQKVAKFKGAEYFRKALYVYVSECVYGTVYIWECVCHYKCVFMLSSPPVSE